MHRPVYLEISIQSFVVKCLLLFTVTFYIFVESTLTQNCLSHQYVCDGIPDCYHGDDEFDCHHHLCPTGCVCNNYIIHCEGEHLRHIPQTSTSQLYILLANNTLTIDEATLDFHKSILKIDLSHNHLMRLNNTFRNQSLLEHINISHNEIVYIARSHFETLTYLKVLDISYNRIRRLTDQIMYGLSSLIALDCSSNGLTYIGKHIFQNNISLQTVYLQGNDLSRKRISLDAFSGIRFIDTLILDETYMCCFILSYNSCTPLSSDAETLPRVCSPLLETTLVKLVCWGYGVVSLACNALAFGIQVAKHKKEPSPRNVILIQQHLSDLFIGIHLLVVGLADSWYGSNYFIHQPDWMEGSICYFMTVLSMFSMSSSSLCVFGNALACHLVIVRFPFRRDLISVRLTWAVVIAVDLLTIIISVLSIVVLPLILGSSALHTDICIVFNFNKGVLGFNIFVIIYLITGSIIFIFLSQIYYVQIVRYVQNNQFRKQTNKLINNVFVMLDIFPWLVLFLCVCLSFHIKTIMDVSKLLTIVLIPINACLNPFIFTFHTYFSEFVTLLKMNLKAIKSNSQPA